MFQKKTLCKMKMFRLKSQVRLRYPLALNRNIAQRLKQLQIRQHYQPPDSRVCPTVLNVRHSNKGTLLTQSLP